jgi:MFS family permease
VAVPVVGGLIYGYWAAAINRDGGPITGWNVLFGFVCAIAVALLYVGVRMLAPLMHRELHAVLWLAFSGISFGFLYAQTGASVLRSTLMALGVAAGVFAVAFYRYYTHEDAKGHPDPR